MKSLKQAQRDACNVYPHSCAPLANHDNQHKIAIMQCLAGSANHEDPLFLQ